VNILLGTPRCMQHYRMTEKKIRTLLQRECEEKAMHGHCDQDSRDESEGLIDSVNASSPSERFDTIEVSRFLLAA
jgi:hypothetical protein